MEILCHLLYIATACLLPRAIIAAGFVSLAILSCYAKLVVSHYYYQAFGLCLPAKSRTAIVRGLQPRTIIHSLKLFHYSIV